MRFRRLTERQGSLPSVQALQACAKSHQDEEFLTQHNAYCRKLPEPKPGKDQHHQNEVTLKTAVALRAETPLVCVRMKVQVLTA